MIQTVIPIGERSLSTRDLEQARDIVTRIYIPHDVSTRNRGPLNFKLTHLESERFTIGHCTYGADTDLWVPPMDDCYHINLTLGGHTMVSQGGVDAHTEGRRSGVFFGPLDPFTVRWSPEAVQYAVKIPRVSLEMHLSRLLNRSVHDPVDFGLTFDLSSGAGQALLATVAFLRDELERPGGVSTMPGARDQLESMILTQILMTIPSAFSERLIAPQRAASHRRVQAAIELIHDHPERNVTVVELAEAVGATPRGLQRGFKEAVGTSPAAYMREIRLDRVRDELVVGACGDTVTDVAMRWGFFHLGRFSQQYRQRFGHLPSETLRRARPATML